MFDVGFWELSLILLVGLIVLGPERLPKAARTVGFYMRKLRTFVITAQQQLESEIDAESLRRDIQASKQNVQGALSGLRDELENTIKSADPRQTLKPLEKKDAAASRPDHDAP